MSARKFRLWPKKEPPSSEPAVSKLLKTELDEAILRLQAFTQEVREAEDMAEVFLKNHPTPPKEETGD